MAAITQATDLARVRLLRRALPEVPLLALTRIALPEIATVEELGISLMFPGFDGGVPGSGARRRWPLALPGTIVGPVVGRPKPADRRLVGLLRSAGIRASSRGDMQAWLTVTSAWLGPLRGAIVASARQELALAVKPDLITVAARAARERLRLVRNAGFPLDERCVRLLVLPELWAIARFQEIARSVLLAPDLPCLPSYEEAVVVGERLKVLAGELGVATPAANFLDGFTREEAGGRSEHAAANAHEFGGR